MLYAKRTVRCSANRLTKAAARESLLRQFEDAEVLELQRQGNEWVATLLEPKQADFPPKDDDEPTFTEDKAEDSSDDGDSKDDSNDGPPSDDSEGPKPPKAEKGEKGEIAAVLDILTAIADKLGIVPGGDPMVPGADDPLAAPPPPPAPGPPGGGGPNELLHRTKLKPGETPPGGTPIGAPAFASTDISRLASFDAFDDTPGKTIKEAHRELTELYGPHGFAVRQIKRVEGGQRLAAKLSRR